MPRPRLIGWGHYAMMTVVCRSVCPVPKPKSRMEEHSKLKIGRRDIEAHDTDDPWPHLDVKRSKVKVTKPINSETENEPYLRNGKAYKLQTWYTAGVRRSASPPCAVTSKVKGHTRLKSDTNTIRVWRNLNPWIWTFSLITMIWNDAQKFVNV